MKLSCANILALFLMSILVGCGENHNLRNFYYNKSFEYIASISLMENKDFCIVLADFHEKSYSKYKSRLEKVIDLYPRQVIYNFVDVNNLMSDKYIKWLAPISLPVTCVFSYKGRLIDIVPGMANESLLYVEKALENGEITQYHYPNRFNSNKEQLIPFLNNVLQCMRNLDQGIFLNQYELLNESSDYPYYCYLCMIGEMLSGDTIKAQDFACRLIEMENPYYLDIYRDEFVRAKKVIDPDFDISKEPILIVNSKNIDLPQCNLNEKVPFRLHIRNDGEKTLRIYKLFKSCSCLKQKKDINNMEILPKDSIVVDFVFEADRQGKVTREIFVTSNAINESIVYVKISATVL